MAHFNSGTRRSTSSFGWSVVSQQGGCKEHVCTISLILVAMIELCGSSVAQRYCTKDCDSDAPKAMHAFHRNNANIPFGAHNFSNCVGLVYVGISSQGCQRDHVWYRWRWWDVGRLSMLHRVPVEVGHASTDVWLTSTDTRSKVGWESGNFMPTVSRCTTNPQLVIMIILLKVGSSTSEW